MQTLGELTRNHAQHGKIEWIGVRFGRREPMQALAHVTVTVQGLEGDHYQPSNYTGSGKRAVTLVQAEHLPVIASLAGLERVTADQLRRNLVVSGINLLGLRSRRFRIGTAVLEGSGLCAPCSRMEEELGKGGYAAVRGHGGICARIVTPGVFALGDALIPE